MASGGSNISITSDSSFEDHRGRYCSICYMRYAKDGSSVPRILTCGHSFCTGCLERLIGNVLRGYIRCPACKTDTMIPGLTNEVSKLAKNFGVLDLLESIDEEKKTAAASEVHISLPPICSEHENEPKKVYCLTDGEIICIYCQVYGNHSGHNCELVSKLAQEYRTSLRTSCEQLQSKKEAIVGARSQVNDTASAVCFKEEKIMREVTHHFEWLRRKLQRRELQVKALLKNRTSAKCMLLDKQKRRMSELITKCEEQYHTCQTVISGPDHEVVLQKNTIENDIQALTTQVGKHDTSPCTRDDLMCHLDIDLADRMNTHGSLMKDSRKGESVPELEQSSSSPSADGSITPGSDSTGDSEDVEWQELRYMPSSPSTSTTRMFQGSPRRLLEGADVILLNDDMDMIPTNNNRDVNLDPSNNNNIAPASGGRTPVQAAGESSPIRSSVQRQVLSPVQRQGAGDGRGMTCGGCGSPHPEHNRTYKAQKRTLHQSTVLPGRRRTRNGETTTSEESPDLSELSDMELDRSIRSAWSNRGGWSASQEQLHVMGAVGGARSTSQSELIGAVGGASASASNSPTRSISAREVINAMENTQVILSEDLDDRRRSTPVGNAQSRRADPWEVFVAAPPRRSRTTHSRPGPDMKCSVYNCSTGATSFYVKCKNCSRIFCQRCTSSSISARRCYKRPRGHSFVFIPCSGVNSSANNNQVSHHHQHGRNRQAAQLGTSGPEGDRMPDWQCTNCSAKNKYSRHSHTCIKCGRQSRTRSGDNRRRTAPGSIPQSNGTIQSNGHSFVQIGEANGEDDEVVELLVDVGSGGDVDHHQNEAPEDEQQHVDNAGDNGDDNQAAGAAGGAQPQGGAAAAAAASSGISSSTMSSNDSGYENVCPSCATVNTEDAMHCTSCSAQLFL